MYAAVQMARRTTKSTKSTKMTMTEARAAFAKVLTLAERGEAVEVTRDGRPVAVILSFDEYQKVRKSSVPPSEALREFLNGLDRRALSGEDPWKGVRDRGKGRDFRW